MKISIITCLCVLILLALSSYEGSCAQDKPNVIIVMTDDQGYGELSCHGNPILKTPNLDILASQSMRLKDYHAAPMCTPTRGQLMSGMDAARNGAINVSSGRALLRPELSTMADIFSANGYHTGIFGKWHLGDNYPFRPEDRGFQETIWFPSSHIGSVPDFWGNNYFDDTYIRNGKREKFEGYCTDIFFENALEFMRKSAKAGRPFFTYLPTNTPHGPLFAKEEDIKAMEAAFAESAFSDMKPGLKDRLTRYLAMIRNIDTNMGRLVEFLEKEGLAENTILIFATDNGSTHGPLYFNAGMRGMKTQLWEGGHRVPCFIRWPDGGFTPPHDIEGLTQVQDILPTLIDLCELDKPSSSDFDGISLAPVFRGERDVPEDRMLVISYSRMPVGFNSPSPYSQSILTRDDAGVLWKRWRLLEDRELYDLSSDPLQQTNVIDRYPEVAEKMRKHLYDWWDEVKNIANVPQRVVIGHEKENPVMLTACEWLDVFVDQQGQVRRGTKKTGYWCLEVAEAGEYEFELRRWPKEIDVPLMESGSTDGTALPISKARIFISNANHLTADEKRAYGFEGLARAVEPGETSATFTVPLEAGPMALHTWFDDEKGETICSAYYVFVRRL
jgi:arylsulfatase A-like enzyme